MSAGAAVRARAALLPPLGAALRSPTSVETGSGRGGGCAGPRAPSRVADPGMKRTPSRHICPAHDLAIAVDPERLGDHQNRVGSHSGCATSSRAPSSEILRMTHGTTGRPRREMVACPHVCRRPNWRRFCASCPPQLSVPARSPTASTLGCCESLYRQSEFGRANCRQSELSA